jgi:hypothetical protein
MIVVGGTYLEECDWPEWKRIMGPGVRAVLAVSRVSPGSELYTFVHAADRADLESTMSGSGVKLHTRSGGEQISFYYKHPLGRPKRFPSPAEETASAGSDPWKIEGETVLAFRLLESKVQIKAERAVVELSKRDEEISCSDVKSLALVAAENDFPELLGPNAAVRDFATKMMMAHKADLLIVRRQSGGAVLFDGEVQHKIPAYAARSWFKIGAGNVFCAMFAHYWGDKKKDPVQAADLASRSSAHYAGTQNLPVASEEELPVLGTFDPDLRCKVFVASPCISMAQQWLLNEALNSFDDLGVDVVSPYDLGLDGFPSRKEDVGSVLDDCDAVLALAEGADIPAVLAVGLARIRRLPIVILAEQSNGRRLDLWEGTNCEIAGDFASAVYRTMVAGKGRATA